MTSDEGDDPERLPASAAPRHDVARPSGATGARLGLGRVGAAMPTRAVLDFALDHARARDAVHTPLDVDGLDREIAAIGLGTLRVESAAPDRETYLRRPDFGRRLSARSRSLLAARPRQSPDVVLIVGDGLSSTAVQTGAAPLLIRLVPRLRAMGLTLAPVVLASQARVALGDEVGELLEARLALMCIGERPGLSAADSLGGYLTLSPRLGRTDADRNCVSNIRAGGLEADLAAFKLAWLVDKAFATGASGVLLKDDSDAGKLSLPGEASPADGGHGLRLPPGEGTGGPSS